MKWSWKLGNFAGIDVKIHATFVLLLGFIGLSHWLADGNWQAAATGVGFMLALFLCVVLHEYGHALTARRYGIPTRDITLLPIGGVARLERMPDKPEQEFWVAAAGPAVNLVIASGLMSVLIFTGNFTPLSQLSFTEGPFLERLMVANVWLVLFNLIPAFPMDGGRLLRALLASRLDYPRATQIAASLGQAAAFVFGFIGLFSNPFLIFIALFVWIGATQEASAVQMRAAFAGTPVHAAMVTDFQTLTPGNTLSDAARLVLRGSQQDFPVVQEGRVVGILTRTDLLRALAEQSDQLPVTVIMQGDFLTADAHDMMEPLFQKLSAHECHTMPVLHAGRLVGVVTMDNVGEYFMIESARRKNPRTPPSPLVSKEFVSATRS